MFKTQILTTRYKIQSFNPIDNLSLSILISQFDLMKFLFMVQDIF